MSTTDQQDEGASDSGIKLDFIRAEEDPRGPPVPSYQFRSNKLVVEDHEEGIEASHMTRKAALRHRQKQTNLRLTFLMDHAHEDIQLERLYSDFFWFVPFVVFFVLFVLVRRDTEGYYWNSLATGSKVSTEEFGYSTIAEGPNWGKAFYDIANQDDWQTWVTTVVMPIYWPGETTNAVNNTVFGNNIKIGAMRFRTVRVNNYSCSLNRQIIETGSLFPEDCYGRYNDKARDTTQDSLGLYKPIDCKSSFVMNVEGKIRNWGCEGNVFDLPFAATAAEANLELSEAEFSTYFADATVSRFAMLEFIHYNPTLDIFSLSQNWVEISAGGAYLPQVKTIFFEVHSSEKNDFVAYSVWVFFCVLVITFRWFMHLVSAMKRSKGFRYLLNVWNLLELINIVIFFVMFGFHFAWWGRSNQIGFKIPTGRVGFNEDLHHVAALYDTAIFLNGINTVITFLKFLKFTALNRRLRIVTRSIARAQQNIIGLMVLFLVVLLAYSLTGMAMFGTGIEDFRNLEVSFSTMMRILLGDFDYPALRDENYFLAGIFFWSFLILGLFLLLNFIIAVIGNAFGQENADLIVEPLDQQIYSFFSSIYRVLKRFASHPLLAIDEWRMSRKESWARETKLEIVLREMQAYRHALPIDGISYSDFEMLPESEKEVFRPDPHMNRAALNDMFSRTEGGRQKLAYLGEIFLDDFFISAVVEMELFDQRRNRRVARRKRLMADWAERQLRSVLGLSGGEPTDDALSVQELLAPAEVSVQYLGALSSRVQHVEDIAAELGSTLCSLTTTLSDANAEDTSSATGLAAGAQVAPTVPVPLQRSKVALPGLGFGKKKEKK